MALMLPKQRGVTREANFSGQPSTTWGTVLTSDGVAHTYPATYTDLIASTSYESDWVNIWFHGNATTNVSTDSLVTIYVGASTAEQVIIPDLLAGWAETLNSTGTRCYGFPLAVPAGSRLSARHQSVRTSQAVYIMIELLGGGRADHWTGTRVEAVGIQTASSRGTSATPGTTSAGTLTSIGTSTYEWGYVLPMLAGNYSDASMNANVHSISIGNASAIIPGLDDFTAQTSSLERSWNSSGGRYCTIPASTALYISGRVSGTAEATDYAIYGVH